MSQAWHRHSCLCLPPDPDTWEHEGREQGAPCPAGKARYSFLPPIFRNAHGYHFYAADACAAAWSTCSGGRVSASAAAVPAWGLGLLAPNSPFSTSDPELCASKTFFVSPDAGCRSSESFFSPPESCPSASDAVIPALDAGLRSFHLPVCDLGPRALDFRPRVADCLSVTSCARVHRLRTICLATPFLPFLCFHQHPRMNLHFWHSSHPASASSAAGWPGA